MKIKICPPTKERVLIPNHTILKRSGFEVTQHRNCPSLKKSYWDPQELTMTGDAPKDFLRVYEYRKGCRRSNPTSWPKFIAKVGHKYYPNESVTEHLITLLIFLSGSVAG